MPRCDHGQTLRDRGMDSTPLCHPVGVGVVLIFISSTFDRQWAKSRCPSCHLTSLRPAHLDVTPCITPKLITPTVTWSFLGTRNQTMITDCAAPSCCI